MPLEPPPKIYSSKDIRSTSLCMNQRCTVRSVLHECLQGGGQQGRSINAHQNKCTFSECVLETVHFTIGVISFTLVLGTMMRRHNVYINSRKEKKADWRTTGRDATGPMSKRNRSVSSPTKQAKRTIMCGNSTFPRSSHFLMPMVRDRASIPLHPGKYRIR